LVELHRQGLTFQSLPPADKDDPVWRETWRESILVINQAANFGDLTLVRRMLPGEDVAGAARKDVIFLGRLFRWFLTGRAGAPTAALNIHPAFQEIVNKVNSQAYRTAQEFLEDLSRVQIADVAPKRSLRQTTGYTTSVGIVREANEDFVGRYSFAMEQKPGTPELGLYVVADGMGGHAAGELASKDVVRVVVDRIHQLQSAPALTAKTRRLTEEEEVSNPLGDTLRTAILEANGILFKSRQASRSDRGTTITSALVLGDAAVVANVGDSRTYLLRDGELKQVSNDHSLVASLVAAGMITPEQALTHPQRNQIYRTLGDKPKVDVDIFPLSLNANDTLLLCSDGLWEMVRDETIRGILMAARTPQMACDELIKAANLAGGEDNVSVIVVRLE
jgi:protein phosphatase